MTTTNALSLSFLAGGGGVSKGQVLVLMVRGKRENVDEGNANRVLSVTTSSNLHVLRLETDLECLSPLWPSL